LSRIVQNVTPNFTHYYLKTDIDLVSEYCCRMTSSGMSGSAMVPKMLIKSINTFIVLMAMEQTPYENIYNLNEFREKVAATGFTISKHVREPLFQNLTSLNTVCEVLRNQSPFFWIFSAFWLTYQWDYCLLVAEKPEFKQEQDQPSDC